MTHQPAEAIANIRKMKDDATRSAATHTNTCTKIFIKEKERKLMGAVDGIIKKGLKY
jgi:hypothetical protein